METIEIDLNNVLHLEDVRLPEVSTVDGYIKELRWFQKLIDSHIDRCKYWKDNEPNRPGLEKLNDFLSQFEEA